MIDQLSVFLENKTGRLAEMARAMGDAGINMRALMVADTSEYGVARIICDSPNSALEALTKAGFAVSITPVIAVEIPDRPGGLADVLDSLGNGGVNVEYAYAFVEPSGQAAVDVFRVEDPERACEVLSQAGVKTVRPEELYRQDG